MREVGTERPMKISSSLFMLQFVMSRCIREGWRVSIEATLIENSKVSDLRSLWLKLKLRILVLRFIASIK